MNIDRQLTSREAVAADLADRLDTPTTVVGLLALILWLAEPAVTNISTANTVVEVVWIVIWVGFVVEFASRLVAAPSTGAFLRKHWWELVFLLVPFLRFIRVGRALRGARLGRAGRGVASAIRSSRTAGSRLGVRLTWLGLVTAVIAFASGRLLWDLGGYENRYGDALHDALLGVVAGESFPTSSVGADALEIGVAIYHLLIVGTLAGTAGAFFLERAPSEES